MACAFFADDDENALWAKFFALAHDSFGVTAMLYAFTHSKYTVSRTGIMPSIYLRHNYPDDYIATHGSEFTLDDSVAATLVLDGNSHLFWSDFPALQLTPGQRQRLAKDADCGMSVGVSFGFRFGANSGFAGLCWASRHADPAAFKSAIMANRAAIDEVAQEFQVRMRNAMIASRIRLTPRQKEVLSYSAGGMTAKQIASHLNLSQKTVTNTDGLILGWLEVPASPYYWNGHYSPIEAHAHGVLIA
jgi:Bacterial regulatory proteins, luxR family/Autoinducer binding domain